MQPIVHMSDHATLRPLRWALPVQVLHWATAVLLIGLFVSGWNGRTAHPPSSLHVSLGFLLLVVVLLRIAARTVLVAPKAASQDPAAKLVALGVHAFLYFGLLAAAASGLAAYAPHPFVPPPLIFGLARVPRIFAFHPELTRFGAAAHGYVAWSLLGAVVLHIVGVFRHILFTDHTFILRMLGRQRG